MKFLSISLTIAATALAAISAIAAPASRRALEQEVDIYSRLIQPLPHQVHHHETANTIKKAVAASRQAASDSHRASEDAPRRGQRFVWKNRFRHHSRTVDELKILYDKHSHAETLLGPTLLHDQVHEDKAKAEEIIANAEGHSREAEAINSTAARQLLPARRPH